jgi:hypothetical protein
LPQGELGTIKIVMAPGFNNRRYVPASSIWEEIKRVKSEYTIFEE